MAPAAKDVAAGWSLESTTSRRFYQVYGNDQSCHTAPVACVEIMPTSLKDRNASPADWEPIAGVSFPRELYLNVLIEDAERELVDRARQMTRELLAPRCFTEE